jgi:hypothetical protein
MQCELHLLQPHFCNMQAKSQISGLFPGAAEEISGIIKMR